MSFDVAGSNLLKDGVILQNFNAASSSAYHDLGYKVRATDGREYTYSLISSAMTVCSIPTYPAFFLGGTDDWTVTSTLTPGAGRNFAGVFCMALAAGNNYVWVQTAGRVPSAAMSTNYTASQALTCVEAGMFSDLAYKSGCTTFTVAELTEAMYSVLATALEAGSTCYGDTSKADIMLL